jgi:sec-independent protein translocase protein TatC
MHDRPMSFTEHLGELRDRLLRSVLAVVVGFAAAYAFHQQVFGILARPVLDAMRRHGVHALQALQVTETITVYLQVSLIAGLFLASPYLLWQVWAFVAPGLLARERRFVVPVLAGASAFFALGVAFCYFVFLPMVVDFLVGFTLSSGDIALVPTVQKTFSLTATFLGVFGLVFEMPLLMFFLALLGVVNHRKLLAFGRYFVVLSFVVAAIFTPPDPMSQTLMAVPLCILYFVGTAFAWVAGLMRHSKGSAMPKVVVGLVFALFAGAIGLASWLWQQSGQAPQAGPSLGAGTVVALRANTAATAGAEAIRRLPPAHARAADGATDVLVSVQGTAVALDRLDGDCPPEAVADAPACRVLGPAPAGDAPPEPFAAIEDRDVPVVLIVAGDCAARLVPDGFEAPAWMAFRAGPAGDGGSQVRVRFAAGGAADALATWAIGAGDGIGPQGPAADLESSPLGRVVAWSRGELSRETDGFSLPAGPRLAGRVVGELAAAALSRCGPASPSAGSAP